MRKEKTHVKRSLAIFPPSTLNFKLKIRNIHAKLYLESVKESGKFGDVGSDRR
jgi:hypothetical protein